MSAAFPLRPSSEDFFALGEELKAVSNKDASNEGYDKDLEIEDLIQSLVEAYETGGYEAMEEEVLELLKPNEWEAGPHSRRLIKERFPSRCQKCNHEESQHHPLGVRECIVPGCDCADFRGRDG